MSWKFEIFGRSGGGNSKDIVVTFNPPEKRENINSGEKHKTIFGKIYRWFADLKPVAFTGSYHVANFWDGVNEAGIGFTSNTKGKCGLHPHADGAGSLGEFFRWNQVYAVNSAISTSDRNEKKEISYIGSKSSYEDTSITDEKLIQLIMGLRPVIFIRINGESDRPHHGIIAQEFEELMAEIGLHDHAAFIKSPVVEMKEVETKDKDGNIKHKMVEETVTGEYRYGIRYEEFIADLIKFCQLLKDENSRRQKKIEDLEERMKILENAVKCS